MRTIEAIVRVVSTPWLAKVVLALVFGVQLGIAPFFFEVVHEIRESDSMSGVEWQQEREKWQIISVMTTTMLAEAQAKGPSYSPDDYFSDLIQIEEKKRELGAVTNGTTRDTKTTELQEVIRVNGGDKRYSAQDWDNARVKFKEYIDPGRIPREEFLQDIADSGGWPVALKEVTLWFISLYPRMLPLALVLFLLWIKEGARDVWEPKEFERMTRVFLRNPLTFALLVLAYPVVIAYVWRRKASLKALGWKAEAELRRTKSNLFRRLSRDESELLAEFVRKRMSRRQIRKVLAERGMRQRHWFATALAATMLVAIIGGIIPSTAHAVCLTGEGLEVSTVMHDDGARAGPVVSGSDELGGGPPLLALVPDAPAVVPYFLLIECVKHEVWQVVNGVTRAIEQIPIFRLLVFEGNF